TSIIIQTQTNGGCHGTTCRRFGSSRPNITTARNSRDKEQPNSTRSQHEKLFSPRFLRLFRFCPLPVPFRLQVVRRERPSTYSIRTARSHPRREAGEGNPGRCARILPQPRLHRDTIRARL